MALGSFLYSCPRSATMRNMKGLFLTSFFKDATFVYESFRFSFEKIFDQSDFFCEDWTSESGYVRIRLVYRNKDSLEFIGICWVHENKSILLKFAAHDSNQIFRNSGFVVTIRVEIHVLTNPLYKPR